MRELLLANVGRGAAATLLFTLASGCASGAPDGPGQPASEDRVHVQVRNGDFPDARIFALRGGRLVELGFVPGFGERTFALPSYYVRGSGRVELVADPVGSRRRMRSDVVLVSPGDLVLLELRPSLGRPWISVRSAAGRPNP